jgi:hypothetical protein
VAPPPSQPNQPAAPGAAPNAAPGTAPRTDNKAPDNKTPAPQLASAKANASDKPSSFNLFDLSSYDSVLSRIIGTSRQGDTDGSSKKSAGN